MEKQQRQICTYCSKWFPVTDMIELHEKGKPYILYYCESCYQEVRSNINNLPWRDDFTFYRK
jgi:RNase P subunit RPR2